MMGKRIGFNPTQKEVNTWAEEEHRNALAFFAKATASSVSEWEGFPESRIEGPAELRREGAGRVSISDRLLLALMKRSYIAGSRVWHGPLRRLLRSKTSDAQKVEALVWYLKHEPDLPLKAQLRRELQRAFPEYVGTYHKLNMATRKVMKEHLKKWYRKTYRLTLEKEELHEPFKKGKPSTVRYGDDPYKWSYRTLSE